MLEKPKCVWATYLLAVQGIYEMLKCYVSDTMHFWPYVGKAEMHLAVESLFEKF